MSFPSDINNAMRECILNVLWAKDDIVSIFQNNGCVGSDLRSLGSYKELPRVKIVDSMFSHLSMKPDGGLGQFCAMLQTLLNWSQFDSYYIDTLKKLNREEARRKLDHLKQLQEIRDNKIKEARARREQKEKKAQTSKRIIEDLKNLHIHLLQGSLPVQKRGYELEKILLDLSKLSGLEVTDPFIVKGEQIDGAIKYDGEHYIVGHGGRTLNYEH